MTNVSSPPVVDGRGRENQDLMEENYQILKIKIDFWNGLQLKLLINNCHSFWCLRKYQVCLGRNPARHLSRGMDLDWWYDMMGKLCSIKVSWKLLRYPCFFGKWISSNKCHNCCINQIKLEIIEISHCFNDS